MEVPSWGAVAEGKPYGEKRKLKFMVQRRCLPQGVLERVSQILGDTEEGLTGSQIDYFLKQCGLEDVAPNITKWKRIYSAFANEQNNKKCSNSILKFIQTVINPTRYINMQEFERKRNAINEALSYIGYELGENGKYHEVIVASTISEAQRRANELLFSLKARNAHSDIFKYCKAELVDKNYFHAIFEATKGLFERIRVMSQIEKDGIKLVQHVFGGAPILLINAYQNKQEVDEQKGFLSILEGLCNMFRNPESHQPKLAWPIGEQDALEILSMISYCHRRLDTTRKREV